MGPEDAAQQTPYSSLIGGQQPPQAQPQPPAGYLGVTQPNSVDPSSIVKPAGSPEEVETRKAGWKTLLDHPHFNDAMMAMGASLAQPRQIGQTGAGQLSQSMMAGYGTLKAGEYNDYQASLKEREEQRKEAESAAEVGAKKAATPGIAARSKEAEGEVDAHISAAKTAADKAILDLKSAKDKDAVESILKGYEKKKAEVLAGLDEGDIKKAALQELDKGQAEIDRIRKNANYFQEHATEATARGRKAGAEADQQELTTEILKKMDPDEQKAFLTKSGKYSHTTSAIAQQRDMWADIYDKLPATNPSKKGVTREEFVMHKLSDAKKAESSKIYIDYIKNTLPSDRDPDLERSLLDAMKSDVATRTGGKPDESSQTSSGVIKWERGKDGKPVPVQPKKDEKK